MNQTILIVEDDTDDLELLTDALKKADPEVDIKAVENGLEAISYLQEQLRLQAPLPGLVVLDLNMPYLDGKTTFQTIRNNAALKDVPIMIFTSSQNPNDLDWFQRSGVEMISKPFHFSKMKDIAQHMLAVSSSQNV